MNMIEFFRDLFDLRDRQNKNGSNNNNSQYQTRRGGGGGARSSVSNKPCGRCRECRRKLRRNSVSSSRNISTSNGTRDNNNSIITEADVNGYGGGGGGGNNVVFDDYNDDDMGCDNADEIDGGPGGCGYCICQHCSSTSDNPPVHPVQSFHRICTRIESNDETLTCVDLRDEFLNVRKLAKALSVNTNVKHLHLQRTIRDRETQDSRPRSAPAHDVLNLFMEGFRYNTGLVTLDLSQTCIRSAGALFVSRGLQDHPTLQKLRLSRCILQDEGVRRLGMAPLGQKLQELDLSRNLLSDGAPLRQILLMNPNLQSINLSVNYIGPKSLESFLKDGFLSLRSLNLSRNQICWDGPNNALGRALGVGYGSATTEQFKTSHDGAPGVHIVDETPHDDETTSRPSNVADVLLRPRVLIHCQLEELRLDCNMLSNEMAESIANGLLTNTSLRKLDLSQNFVGNKGAAALAMSISANPHCKLRDLCLGTNKIACRGALALLLFACSSTKNNSSGGSGGSSSNCHPGHELTHDASPSFCRTDSVKNATEASIVENRCSSENGLTRLDLSNNKISDGQAISNALRFVETHNDSPPDTGESTNSNLKDEKIKSSSFIVEWNDMEQRKNLPDPRQPSSLRYLNIHRNPIALKYKQEIQFWTRLNASGGRRLLSIAGNNECRGDALARWPRILGDVSDDPNSIFFFLVRKPEMCSFASSLAATD